MGGTKKTEGRRERCARWGAFALGLVMLVVGLGCQVMLWSVWIFDDIEMYLGKNDVFTSIRPGFEGVTNVLYPLLGEVFFLEHFPQVMAQHGSVQVQLVIGLTFLLLHCLGLSVLCLRTVERPSRVAAIGWGVLAGACFSLGLGFSLLVSHVAWWWFNMAGYKTQIFSMLASTVVGVYFAYAKGMTGRRLMWMQLVFLGVVEALVLFIVAKGGQMGSLFEVPSFPTFGLGQMLALYMLATGIALAASYRRHVRRVRETADHPVCVACGYDQRGADPGSEGVCPECGKGGAVAR
jgi:hypothetical protein